MNNLNCLPVFFFFKAQAELLKLKSCLTKDLSWDTWLSDTSKSIAHPANAEVGTVHYQQTGGSNREQVIYGFEVLDKSKSSW